MTERALHTLARLAGVETVWRDYQGVDRRVSDATLVAVLGALGWASDTPDALSDSLLLAQAERDARPTLLTVTTGETLRLRTSCRHGRLRSEAGGAVDIALQDEGGGWSSLTAPAQLGYHTLVLDDGDLVVAVAPPRALTAADVAPGRRLWGSAAQVYSLNGGGAFGDFGDVGRVARRLAQLGADALAISPVHALFAADPARHAPYGPSTRLFLNPLFATVSTPQAPSTVELIDWSVAAPAKFQALDEEYAACGSWNRDRPAFDAFVAAGGQRLLDHARFEALDARFRPMGLSHWRDWPGPFADSTSTAVQAMSASEPEVERHLFRQWRADRALASAHAAAKSAGMAVGLIADLAVGMDGAGSHAWSRPQDVLTGLSIGAPPDLLAKQGQDWGLTSFSPSALKRQGYRPFLETLRAALRHAGGVRIDHAIGLERLWVTPHCGEPGSGAYVRYPLEDLLRLIALESHRRGAIVVGEDLGTVPEGFRARSTTAGLAGMRVLWFERDGHGGFIPPQAWDGQAMALTTTHDLPTTAGWWRGRDIDWRERLALDPDPTGSRVARQTEKTALWDAMLVSGAAQGSPPGEDGCARVVDAAVTHVGLSHCDLAVVPLEDLIGEDEQPNLPGTVEVHPNWRRRLPPGEGLDAPTTLARIERLNAARREVV